MQTENSSNISDHADRLWGYSDLAMFLRVSESKLRHDVMSRKIPHVRLAGRSVRFVPKEIHAWLADQAVGARG